MNYGYNQNYANPYNRNYAMPNYNQPQYLPQQPMPQQTQQPMQPIQQEMPIQYVGYATIKEAEAYILMPNAKALFIDRANGMVYEKICGQDGQSFITHFKRVENKAENQAVEQKQEPTIDLSSYVKKDDLGQFVSLEKYNQLLGKVEQLQKQIMGVKPNVGAVKQ